MQSLLQIQPMTDVMFIHEQCLSIRNAKKIDSFTYSPLTYRVGMTYMYAHVCMQAKCENDKNFEFQNLVILFNNLTFLSLVIVFSECTSSHPWLSLCMQNCTRKHTVTAQHHVRKRCSIPLFIVTKYII